MTQTSLSPNFKHSGDCNPKCLYFGGRRVKYTESRKPLEFYCYAVRWTAFFLFCFQSHSYGSCKGFQLCAYAHISCDIVRFWQVLTRTFNGQSASIAIYYYRYVGISKACKEINIFTFFFIEILKKFKLSSCYPEGKQHITVFFLSLS